MAIRRTSGTAPVALAVLTLVLLSGLGGYRAESSPSPGSRSPGSRAAGPGNFGDPSALAKGKFLIAGRNLVDPNFARTVVLLVEYGPGGALGLVVNRPTPVKLGSVLPDLEGPGRKVEIFFGGPVSRGSLSLLARSDGVLEEASEVVKGVHVSRSLELLTRLAARKNGRLRVFAGYAGWAPGQLDNEVERGDWYIVPADENSVFAAEPEDLWRLLIPADPSRSAALKVREPGQPG
jgi:putative transcriptional regulator